MRWNWSRLVAVGGGVALMALLACPTVEARGRQSSSPFVRTPYGIIPKSQLYGANMSPSRLQKQLEAEKAAYEKMQGIQNGQPGATAGGKKPADAKKKPAAKKIK